MTRRGAGLLAAGGLAAPVLVGLAYAAAAATGLAGPGAAGFSTARLARVLTEPAVWSGALWSLWVAGAATALAAAAAALVAVAFRGQAPGHRLARTLALVPLPIPHLVAAVGAVLVLGQSGLLARIGLAAGLLAPGHPLPPMVYDRPGVGLILALAWKEFPFLALVAMSVLATRGVALEEAARTLGAGQWTTLRLVTWPLLWRGLLPAVVAVFAFAVGSWETAALLAPSDPLALPLLTLERYTDADLARRGDAFVLVLLGIGIALAAVAAHEWARGRWERFEG